MVTLLDQPTVDRISAEAREVHVSRAVLTVIAALLYGCGWLAARTCTLIWLICAWSFTAVRIGWQEGRKTTRQRAPG